MTEISVIQKQWVNNVFEMPILRTLLVGIMSDQIFKIIFFGVSNDIFENI